MYFFFFNDETLFEQKIISLLSNECNRHGKEIILPSDTFYFKEMKLDGRYCDALAPQGIYDDKPTVIEIVDLRLRNSAPQINRLLANLQPLFRRGYSKLILINKSNDEIYDKPRFDSNIYYDIDIEVWGREKLQRLIEKYPFESTIYDYSQKVNGNNKEPKDYVNRELSYFDIEESNHNFISQLNKVLIKNKISLVLGTGVSIPYNKLTWKALVTSLYNKLNTEDKFDSEDDAFNFLGDDNLSPANYIKSRLKGRYYSSLFHSIYPRMHLYRYYPSNSLEKCSLLIRNNVINKVITYNYDDFLEQSLSAFSYDYQILNDQNDYLNGKFPIFHVHGFMGHNSKIKDIKKNIILTEEEYFECYNDNSRWQVAIQLETFKDNVCLFVGNSLKDFNERRLINITKQVNKYHYAIMSREKLSVSDIVKISGYFLATFNIRIIWTESINTISDEIDKIFSRYENIDISQ